jgi:MFS family permease
MTGLSLALGCVGLVVSAIVQSSPWFYVPAILIGIGQGISLPMLISFVSSSVPPGQRGLALSLRSGVNQAAAAGAPIVTAPIIGFSSISVGLGLAAAIGFAPLVVAALLDLGNESGKFDTAEA